MFAESATEEDDIRPALGFGMVAGIAYATLTGASLKPPGRTFSSRAAA